MNTFSSDNQPHWSITILNVLLVSLVVFLLFCITSVVYANRFLFIRDEAAFSFWSHLIFGFLLISFSMNILRYRLFSDRDTDHPKVWFFINRLLNILLAIGGLLIITRAA